MDPEAPFFALPFRLRGAANVPGAGVLDPAAPIPDDPLLDGAVVHLQVVVVDAYAPGGDSHSVGLSVALCD